MQSRLLYWTDFEILVLMSGQILNLLNEYSTVQLLTDSSVCVSAKDTIGLPRPRAEDIPTGQSATDSNLDDNSTRT